MRYEMILYIAKKDVNNFMASVDMKHEGKWFIEKTAVSFTRKNAVDEKFFNDMIEKSFKNDDFCFPAIEFCGTLYTHPDVKELSDGEKIVYVQGGRKHEKI